MTIDEHIEFWKNRRTGMPIQSPEHRFWWEDEIQTLEDELEATKMALKRANDKLWSAGLPQEKPEEKRAA